LETPHITPATSDDAVLVNLTVDEAARRLRIGRTKLYELVMAGEIRSVTIGKRRLIPAHCLVEYVNNRLDESPDLPAAA
jgi:excisionase family DNA binding protein